MSYQTIRLDVAGPIARIVLARPEAANRVDARLLRELADAAAAIGAAEGVAVTVLEAEGRGRRAPPRGPRPRRGRRRAPPRRDARRRGRPPRRPRQPRLPPRRPLGPD